MCTPTGGGHNNLNMNQKLAPHLPVTRWVYPQKYAQFIQPQCKRPLLWIGSQKLGDCDYFTQFMRYKLFCAFLKIRNCCNFSKDKIMGGNWAEHVAQIPWWRKILTKSLFRAPLRRYRRKIANENRQYLISRKNQPIFRQDVINMSIGENTKFYGKIRPNYAIICYANDFYHIC